MMSMLLSEAWHGLRQQLHDKKKVIDGILMSFSLYKS